MNGNSCKIATLDFQNHLPNINMLIEKLGLFPPCAVLQIVQTVSHLKIRIIEELHNRRVA